MLAAMTTHNVIRALAAAIACSGTPAVLHAQAPATPPRFTETPAQRDARMAWFRDGKFGMFIHWGLYAIPAGQWNGKRVGGVGEWIQTNAPIQVADYEPLKNRFNPVMFDAGAWARAAKRTGMKYIVITSKHHDGFALYDSKVSDWDVMATPFKRDILKELADACEKEGIRLCFYHSIMDWHHPDYLPRRKWEVRPADGADFDRYETYMKAQLKELLTGYGRIGILWFDGEWENTWTHERGKALDAYVRALQPDIIVNNRVDKGRNDMAGLNLEGDWAGDYGTPEQEVPATGLPGVDWESCMTMNDTWGYRSDDHNWKSSTTLIRTLVDINSKGGNFLLNVGPTADGLIPEASLERMAEVGRWMDINAEAVYGTRASPFKRLPWGRATTKGNTLYLHVFDWPTDARLTVPGLQTPVRAATVLGSDHPVQAAAQGDDVVLTLPPAPVHAAATVIKLILDGAPKIIDRPIAFNPDGSVSLLATDANLHGRRIKLEHKNGADSIGFWTTKADHVSWEFHGLYGEFDIELELACEPGNAGSEFVIALGDARLTGVVPDTGSWTTFTLHQAGRMTVPKTGMNTLTLSPGEEFKGALMNLRRVTLRPVPGHVPEIDNAIKK